jgi:hypothetical protein
MNNTGRGYRWLKSKLRTKQLRGALKAPPTRVRYIVRNGNGITSEGRAIVADEMLRMLDEGDRRWLGQDS